MSKIYRLEDFEKIHGKEKAAEIFDKIFSDEFWGEEEEEEEEEEK